MELTAGKVAVVTSAASGIGLALAQRFALTGLDVVLADIEETALGAAAESVERLGVRSLAVRTDVSDAASVATLAAAAVERFGSVHVVCNNAGVETVADPWFGPVTSWQWVMGVNLWGVIHGIRAFLPLLARQGEGHIVNTASMAGLIPGASAPYDAAKHAVVAISEDLYRAVHTMKIDVGVSVLCPGIVATQLLDANRNWPASLGPTPSRRHPTLQLNPVFGELSRRGWLRRQWRKRLSMRLRPDASGYSRTRTSQKLQCGVGRASPPARTQGEIGRLRMPAGQLDSQKRRHREHPVQHFLCRGGVRS